MTKYLPGQEPDFWKPEPAESTFRFALGNVSKASTGAPPLIAIGMNPSHAAEAQSDRTVNRLIEASVFHGYAGWIMLNLYPERSPNPSRLSAYDAGLAALNCAVIEQVLLRYGATEVLGAWGNMPHRTLKRAKLAVQALLDLMGVKVFTWDPLTKRGNPRHPSPPGRPLLMLGPKVYMRREGR
ncbi:DUF1643 domain-containing protein [Flavimobilis sp. GY10621]|uniref:DUF1643 domain-containing protein n=1 Tax=Flavimobilis rhizosphaerae TaxID=2775421 RepID=A0ABR9DQZ1_9MICO|nr:DUF1643 domain-containing protein [Flavimobilis rhizosphaerae]MBD9699559.1 DUF1643 domain-containing protein [Flavimobilis rhizosphaerae]